MKKFVTTLVALLLTVALAVGFTACNDDGENEVYEQVTEEQWNAAFDLLGGDPDKINIEELNITIEQTESGKIDGKPVSGHRTTKIDIPNKAITIIYEGSFGSFRSNSEFYFWQEDDVTYTYLSILAGGFEVEKGKGTSDATILEMYNYIIINFVNDSELGVLSGDLVAINNFSKFDFNEETGAYTATFEMEIENISASSTVNLYFRDGKLAKSVSVINGQIYDMIAENDTLTKIYSYGTANGIVPQNIKDMPVTEN